MLASSRVLLAPIRYGAGIKGKVVDAWRYGLPVVATSMAAEGMRLGGDGEEADGEEARMDSPWGGLVADEPAAFAAAAVTLATDASAWEAAQARSRKLLAQLYGKQGNLEGIRQAIERASDTEGLAKRRASDFTGAMLWHQTARSTEFFSRWIELKESVQGKPKAGG